MISIHSARVGGDLLKGLRRTVTGKTIHSASVGGDCYKD